MSASVEVTSRGDLTAPTTASSAAVREWVAALKYCAAVYLAARIALVLLGAAAWGLSGDGENIGRGGVATMHNGLLNAITGWIKMDSHNFLEIAQHGYQGGNPTAAFFPGYPALVRAASYLCLGNTAAGALLVSNAALLAALVVLYRLTEREFDLLTARRAVLYLCLFPTAFFLFTVYSESVFLLAAVGALALARNRHWAWAGLVGLAAGLTRSAGVIVGIALAVEAIHQTVEDRRSSAEGASWRALAPRALGRLIASAGPVAGVGGYLLYWQLRFHDGSYPLRVQQTVWDRQLSLPWATLWHGMVIAVWRGPLANLGWPIFDFVLVAVGLALGVWVAVRTRPVYAVYCWGSILFFLMQGIPGRPLAADPRFLLVIFPIVWALAWLGKNQRVNDAVVSLSSASLAIVGWLFLTTIKVF